MCNVHFCIEMYPKLNMALLFISHSTPIETIISVCSLAIKPGQLCSSPDGKAKKNRVFAQVFKEQVKFAALFFKMRRPVFS